MIIDTLAHGAHYSAISPRFERAFSFLRRVTDQTSIGRHDIAGDEIFALVQQYDTGPLDAREYESHRKYIDVQYIQRGREMMYWAPLPLLTVGSMAYDPDEDAALYNLAPGGLPLQMQVGQFAVFFPHDGHVTGCVWAKPETVLKVVVKVRV